MLPDGAQLGIVVLIGDEVVFLAVLEEAELAIGDGHALDVVLFGFGLRLVFGDQAGAELVVLGGIVLDGDEGFGTESVFEGILAGDGLAFVGARPSGPLGVASIGIDLSLGRHIFFGECSFVLQFQVNRRTWANPKKRGGKTR